MTPCSQHYSLRAIQMVSDEDLEDWHDDHLPDQLFAKPELPQTIWRAQSPIYVGIEIYLDREGKGTQQEWEMTARLIEVIEKALLDASVTIASPEHAPN